MLIKNHIAIIILELFLRLKFLTNSINTNKKFKIYKESLRDYS